MFSSSNRNSEVKLLQKPVDLSLSAIKAWWEKRWSGFEAPMQKYNPERYANLGNA